MNEWMNSSRNKDIQQFTFHYCAYHNQSTSYPSFSSIGSPVLPRNKMGKCVWFTTTIEERDIVVHLHRYFIPKGHLVVCKMAYQCLGLKGRKIILWRWNRWPLFIPVNTRPKWCLSSLESSLLCKVLLNGFLVFIWYPLKLPPSHPLILSVKKNWDSFE